MEGPAAAPGPDRACASALIVVISGGLVRQPAAAVGIGDTTLTIWSIGKWPVLVLLVIVMIAIAYWAAPNARGLRFKWVTPGSFLALVIWLATSADFAFYVANFASYNRPTVPWPGWSYSWCGSGSPAWRFSRGWSSTRRWSARAIASGHPKDKEPYVELRDTRAWSDGDCRRLEY